jgi:cytochrome c
MLARFLLFVAVLTLAACDRPVNQGRPPRDADLFARGEIAFARRCMSCHNVKIAATGTGPDLVALDGRKAGTRKDFDYSPAMRQSGIVWDAESLDRYLSDPEKMVPGTSMLTEPVKDASERAALVHYILQY